MNKQRKKDGGSNRARDILEKVIHSDIWVNTYLLSIYCVWFQVTLLRERGVDIWVYFSPFHIHSQEPLSCTCVPHSKRRISPKRSKWNSVGPLASLHLGIQQPAGSQSYSVGLRWKVGRGERGTWLQEPLNTDWSQRSLCFLNWSYST